MKLSSAAGLRGDVDELITGLFSFGNVGGLLTDIVGELTAGLGVTIDGVLLKDGIVDQTGKAAAGTVVLQADVAADTVRRFALLADGAMEWGDGAGARDAFFRRYGAALVGTPGAMRVGTMFEAIDNVLGTAIALRIRERASTQNRWQVEASGRMSWGSGAGIVDTKLTRAAANVLKCEDAFIVILDLTPSADIQVSQIDVTLPAGASHNLATAKYTVQRMEAPSGVANVTGIAGGFSGRMIKLLNFSTNAITLNHNNGGSLAANRMMLPGGANYVMTQGSGIELVYNSISDLWWAVGSAA